MFAQNKPVLGARRCANRMTMQIMQNGNTERHIFETNKTWTTQNPHRLLECDTSHILRIGDSLKVVLVH